MNPSFLLQRAAAGLLAICALPGFAALVDQPMPPEQFAACVQSLAAKTGTAHRSLARDDFVRIASTAKYDDRVRQSMLFQRADPTFWWDDIAATTDDGRVAEGRLVLEREADALRRIESQYGVPKEIVVAIYGIETNYGPTSGKIPVLDSAVTLACLRPCADGPRACAARERAYAAVRLVRDRKVPVDTWLGSWAAAFGRTQFVPDTFEQIAADFDGDGVIDIIGSERDAFASTANHLRTRGGWAAGAPVYVEVKVPASEASRFASQGVAVTQRDQARKASQWAAQGWQAVAPDGNAVALDVPGDPMLYPFLPVGLPGPAFLVSRNFRTIWLYNNSDRYVMEVAVLAHKLAGGPGIVTPWPTDDPGLSRAQVKELQAALLQKGYDKVVADGVMGRNTRDAIEAERAKKGLPPGRRAGQRTMTELMR